MSILYIVTPYTSRRDVDGNVYTVVRVVSCATAKTIDINTGWGDGSGVEHEIMKKLDILWRNIHKSRAVIIPKREYKRRVDQCEVSDHGNGYIDEALAMIDEVSL